MATYEEVITDSISADEYLNDYMWVIDEYTSASSSTELSFSFYQADSAVAADALVVDIVHWFFESIMAVETNSNTIAAITSYADSAVAVDVLTQLIEQLIAESASTEEDWFIGTAVMIAELVSASGITTDQASVIQSLSELIVALEAIQTGLQEGISETAGGSELMTNLLRATQVVLEQIIAADAQTSYLLLINTVSEGVSADETVGIWQSLTQSIEEGCSAFVHLTFNGEVYTGWVMNTSNTAVSEYQGLSFNSMCRIGNRYFGATSGGIYELTGAQDSGVDVSTYIQSGLLDFGSTQQKAVPDAYLAVDANGRVALGVSVSEKTQVSTYWYEANRELEAINNVKVPIGKGLKGRYWKFEVASDAVSEFDAVTVLPVVLARRV